MSDLIAASTTDPLSVVRETVGLSREPSEEEKHEAQEMEQARRENGNHSVEKMRQRIDKVTAQRYAAERRAEAAEYDRNELRQQLAQMQSAHANGHLDRALAAEARAAELE